MKIALINPPYLHIYGPDKLAAHSHFSLGLGYIASMLKKNSPHSVKIFDPEAEGISLEVLAKRLRDESPDLVGITCFTPSFNSAVKIGRIAKDNTKAKVILGGIHASSMPDEILEKYPEFDLLVIGEGEDTVMELCELLDTGKCDLSGVKGIAYRKDGRIIKTPPREYITDLDALPFPARELVDMGWYKPNDFSSRGKRSASMITSRGCPHYCIHCASHLTLGRRFRAHSADYVVREIEHLVKDCNIEHIFLKDDTFTYDQERAKDICRRIIDKKLRFEWTCLSRVNTVSLELLKLMKKAGCFCISYGVESGDEQVLKNLKKGATLEQARNAVKMTNLAGIKSQCTFMLGNPGDTRDTINKTINFACELDPVVSIFFILTPYPGTEAHAIYMKGKKEHPAWDLFVISSGNPIIELEGLDKKTLKALITKAHLKFYMRPKQLFRLILRISDFNELKAYVRGALGLCKRLLRLSCQ
ncbi:MAG: radical SAM protein [Candidatus Omnitrophota bacterium]